MAGRLEKEAQLRVAGKIYVIQHSNSHYYKIGLTVDSVQKRLKELQTGNPYRLHIRLSVPFMNVKLAETIVHQRYAQQRGIGEWFYFDPRHSKYPAAIEEVMYYIQNTLGEDVQLRLELKEMMI